MSEAIAVLNAKTAKSAGGFRFPPVPLKRPRRGARFSGVVFFDCRFFVFANFLLLNRRLQGKLFFLSPEIASQQRKMMLAISR